MNPAILSEWHAMYWDRLVRRLTYVVRNREVAEDCASQTFHKALLHMERFRGDSSPYTWLHAIALNETRHYFRQEKTWQAKSQFLTPNDGFEVSLDRALDRLQCAARLRHLMRQIPRRCRRVLADFYVRDYSLKNIAKRQNIPLGTAGRRLYQARRILKVAWENV